MKFHNRIIKNLVITGYSGGSGKTRLIKDTIELLPDRLKFSVSTTTRKPRGNDVNGIDYYFVSVFKFLWMIVLGKFLEFNRPKGMKFYGTPYREYNCIRNAEKAVAFDVDCKGAYSLRKKLGNSVYIVFLNPNKETRERWMLKRGDMLPQEIKSRIEYSENIEKCFFEANKEVFDLIIDNYDENTLPGILANQIANTLLL